MDGDQREDHAQIQPCDKMVVLSICMHLSGLECWVVGEVQILDLSFKCIEDDVALHWENWHTAGVQGITLTGCNFWGSGGACSFSTPWAFVL